MVNNRWLKQQLLPAGRCLLCSDQTRQGLLCRPVARIYPGSAADTDANPCVLPMPLHWRRQWWRGFNQALELARPLAARFDLPLRTDLCRRSRPTRPQADLRGRERHRNVHQAFEVVATAPLPAHVIVVDDVMTSGQTAAALTRCLRQAGVRAVTVWALAIANSSYSRK